MVETSEGKLPQLKGEEDQVFSWLWGLSNLLLEG